MKKHLKTKLRKICKPIVIIAFLASCGSGGGRDNNGGVVSNFAPSVSVADDFSVNEPEQVNLIAQASDSDGSVQSVVWTQISGISVGFENANSSNANFTAPEVNQKH